MALKQLLLTKRMSGLNAQLAALRALDAGFATRSAALKIREAEIETAVNEIKDDTPEADKTAVEESATALETDQAALDTEKASNDTAKTRLEEDIRALQTELDTLNAKGAASPAPGSDPAPDTTKSNPHTWGERKESRIMNNRMRIFGGMPAEQRSALIARDDVKAFLTRTRELGAQTRGVTGADLFIPEILLDLLRSNIAESSKLITKVSYRPLKGKARQNISGTVPEAVWTEMKGALNELEISFNQVEVDGYMVGGFVVIPNSTLQDSDENLAAEILSQISKSIGIALDKAILYGLGTKQPLGVVTRLAQTSEPSGYSDKAPAWADLHTTNITKVSTTGAALIGSIITAFGACRNDFSDGSRFFAMNSVTYAYLITTLLNFNAAGALATGMSGQMPILGGDIVILDFMSNYDIAGGYGDLYLLVEREGTYLASSEHVKFIEGMTVFKGLARYDGLPVIAKAFFVININNASAATAKSFEFDYANTALGALAVTSAADGTTSGKTVISFSGGEASGTTFAYKVAGKAIDVECGDSNTGFTAITTGTSITAATGKIITVVELDGNARIIKVGSAQVIAKA